MGYITWSSVPLSIGRYERFTFVIFSNVLKKDKTNIS